ncbi:hypothetical protein [Haloactinospora alba]|nr:hypothetical protein [Haloactinospora alba]
MTTRTDGTSTRRAYVRAALLGLVLAAVGDAGPEVIRSHSLVVGYDGPGH